MCNYHEKALQDFCRRLWGTWVRMVWALQSSGKKQSEYRASASLSDSCHCNTTQHTDSDSWTQIPIKQANNKENISRFRAGIGCNLSEDLTVSLILHQSIFTR